MKKITYPLVFIFFVILGFNTEALLLEFKDNKALDVWKPVGGEWKIKDGLLEGKTAGYQDLMLNIEGANKWTDYTFEVKGNLIGGRIWGMCFRYVDTLTNYRLNLYEDLDNTNNLYIYKRVNGSFSEVFKVPVGRIDFNKWYTLKLSITKNSMKAYLDNELKIEVEDKAGGIDEGGIALEGETNTVFQVEYVKIDGKGIPATAVEKNGKLSVLWGELKR